MSAHERERLCAYLDGELAAAEAAAVETHLAACAECTALLADMAAVDERYRESTPEAPEGYFDTFAPRVLARVAAFPRKAPARRLPAWAWAAAAVLLLAVVTPLTLKGRVSVPPAAASLETAARPAPAAPAAAAKDSAAAQGADTLERRVQSKEEEQAKTTTAAAPSSPSADRPRERAPEPALLDRTTRQAPAAAPPPAAMAARAPAEEAAANAASGVSGVEGGVPGGVVGGVVGGAPATPPPSQATGGSGARPEAEAKGRAPERDAAVGVSTYGATASAEPRAKSVEARPTSVTLAETGALTSRGDETDALAFAQLEAATPSSALEWRRTRESWRAFAAAHPLDPRADEARVRVVEASVEALRGEGRDADRQALARDAADYLARKDAAQRDRVRAALRRAEALPR